VKIDRWPTVEPPGHSTVLIVWRLSLRHDPPGGKYLDRFRFFRGGQKTAGPWWEIWVPRVGSFNLGYRRRGATW
jgi:hypothetical protein